MALEDKSSQHQREVVDKFHDPIATYQMTTYDYVMRPTANEVTGAIAVTLPPVAEAKGRFYSILALDADIVNTITIHDKDDSECWLGDIVFNSKCDRVLMYSDGRAWLCLAGPGDWPGLLTTIPPGTVCPTTQSP